MSRGDGGRPAFGRTSFLSPRLEARPATALEGMGVFARVPIAAQEVLAVWGGRVVDEAGLRDLTPRDRQLALQVEDGLYLAPSGPPEPADFVNHSCAPNAGLSGQVVLVSMRAIEPGEQVCYDYAMSESTPYDEFRCRCGAAECRGRVTGEDWRQPELQARYEGYFSPYLARKIGRVARRGSASPPGRS